MSAGVRAPLQSLPRRKVATGDVVFLECQPADGAYVVLKVEVQVVATSADGAQTAISRMTAGAMFGEIALLCPNGTRTATLRSFRQAGVNWLKSTASIFDLSLGKAGPLLRYVVGHLCERLVALTVRAENSPDLYELAGKQMPLRPSSGVRPAVAPARTNQR